MINKQIIIRTVVPCICIYSIFRVYSYFSTGLYYPIEINDLFLLVVFTVILEFFWAILEEFQKLTGEFLKVNVSTKILFIFVMLAIFYLYKSTGKI